jgi:hypothetical protein
MHSSVIDTAVQLSLLIVFSNSKQKIFKKALTHVSVAQGKLFDEKKQRPKILCQGPFKL